MWKASMVVWAFVGGLFIGALVCWPFSYYAGRFEHIDESSAYTRKRLECFDCKGLFEIECTCTKGIR